MTEHTQGPWIEGIEGNNSVYGPDGMGRDSGLIATVYKGRGNIRLIAAAPAMYEALKGMLETYTQLVNCGDCGNWNPEKDLDVINSRAVIAKAEGKT